MAGHLAPSKLDDEYVDGTYGPLLGYFDERTTVTLRDEPDVALATADLLAAVGADAMTGRCEFGSTRHLSRPSPESTQ